MFDYRDIEATKLDYKLCLEEKKPRSWLKSVSAFANTKGGYILFGVTNDTHEAVGVDDPQYVTSKVAELITSRISPVPRYEIATFPSDDSTRLCVSLTIQNGPSYPYYYTHDQMREAYVRHGDRSERASDYELNDLILRGIHKTFDSLPSPRKYSDVSFTLLGATYKRETEDELVFPRDLISMGLLTEEGQVTNAGLLLCDQGYLRQSRIVCTRWKGNEKGSVDGDALDDQEFTDASLISLLGNAEAFIRNNSKNPWTIHGMRREENSDYPYRAVREVLVNAMIHRDYQIIGTEIHVDMFDDRLEITSPGGMLSGSRIQDMDLRRVPSMRRNEIISDIFGRLHYMDRRGSGIGRILSSYAEFSEAPQFFSTDTYFLVTLPNRSTSPLAQTTMDLSESQLDGKISQLAERQSQLNDPENQFPAQKRQLRVPFNDSVWELTYFKDVILKERAAGLRPKTINELIRLFERYRYSYDFNRRNIADLFSITENGASMFLKKCIARGIIKKNKVDSYSFVNIQEQNP